MAYSEKVMEHFQNPKFQGEIKNPDAIGRVGNPVCLLPDERLHKNSECVQISKLEKGKKILTHSGYYETIKGKYSRKYVGKIIRLKDGLGSINLTPEHLVYAIKIPRGWKYLRNKGKRVLIPAWYHVKDLVKGDIALYPILKEEKDVKFLEINISKPKYDFKSRVLPKKVPLDSDLLRLFGYFLAEGNIQEKPCKTYISFTLNIDEKNIVEDIKDITSRLFNIDVKIVKRPKRKTANVFLYNAQLARWFKSLFGNGAEHKKLPDFLMYLPIEKQKSLILSLWKGDGYVNLKRAAPRGGYTSISYQLAQQIKTLLLRQNIVPSIYIDKEKKVKGVNHKKAYRIHVGQRKSLKKLCKILNLDYNPKSYESITSWFDESFLYIPITKKEIFEYSGIVNNLEVSNIHSFVSEGFCLHNCGDIMHIYIKVKDSKIDDIKFKTFGCAAAISSTDVVCELAKGKTLKEAEKITKNDVVKALEGLPPEKIHCSLLGEEALKDAIKKYRAKKK